MGLYSHDHLDECWLRSGEVYHCPDTETLAAYVEGSLMEAERAQVEAHLVRCIICRKTVTLAIKTETIVPDPDKFRPTGQ